MGAEPVGVSDQALILALAEIDARKVMARLGGTIKIGEVLAETREKNLIVEILKILKPADKKIIFGLSQYGLSQPKLGAAIKKKLKERGAKARWVVSNPPVGGSAIKLSSADVVLSGLLKKGVELLLIKDKDNVFIARTLAVQEFEKYSKRDYGRPARNVKSGMLPPKLAKMMINLARVSVDKKIIDPFCGSGTILQEALLMGYQDVWGSDVSPKAVKDTQTNLKWLNKPFDYKERIKQIDATRLSDYFEADYFDAIIAEPYLGPPLRGGKRKEKSRK